MFIELTNEDGDKIFANTDNITIIKPYDNGTKFHLISGGFGICQESPLEVIEKINQV